MAEFATLRRSEAPTTRAPDGADVRILLGLARGGMAEFELAPGAVSAAVTHRTVEEIWYVLRQAHARAGELPATFETT